MMAALRVVKAKWKAEFWAKCPYCGDEFSSLEYELLACIPFRRRKFICIVCEKEFLLTAEV